jgi:autotransporter-associated beta strand protein
MLRNLLLNSDGAEPVTSLGSGDVVIGASGDTGELRLTADSSIGTAGGILTVNNPLDLGASQNLICGGGTVRLNGLVTGTGTSGVKLSAGGEFSGELAAGTLTLANPGSTYPGATAVAAGYTLEVAKLANGGSPSSIGASSNTATNLILGGGTLRYTGATAATDRNFTLSPDTVSMIDVSAVDAVLTFSGASTATSGGLIKQGAGTLALAGTNSYTGDTIVNGGTLAVTGASIADTNTLVISGGKVKATGTETVASLFFDEVQQAAGTWGASGSGATHLDDLRFTGSGRISVTTGPFSRWIGGFGLNVEDEAPTADPDADGITNLLEYVLGGNPGVNDATAIAATGTQVGSNYIFTFNRSDLSEADTILTVEYGSDLAVWGSHSVGSAPGAAPVVIQEDAPDTTLDSVTVTIPTGNAPKFFARLKVSN